MALKANVGVSRKVADNNYGSRGASVNVEVELESALVNEPERFFDRIRQVFRLAQQSIDEELTRQQAGVANHATNGAGNGRGTQAIERTAGNGHTGNGNGQHSNGSRRQRQRPEQQRQRQDRQREATQLRQAVVKGIPGLGVRRLENLVRRCTASRWWP